MKNDRQAHAAIHAELKRRSMHAIWGGGTHGRMLLENTDAEFEATIVLDGVPMTPDQIEYRIWEARQMHANKPRPMNLNDVNSWGRSSCMARQGGRVELSTIIGLMACCMLAIGISTAWHMFDAKAQASAAPAYEPRAQAPAPFYTRVTIDSATGTHVWELHEPGGRLELRMHEPYKLFGYSTRTEATVDMDTGAVK